MKALVDQEGKLERQNRAETNLNQNTKNYKGSKESRRKERRPKDDINNRSKENEHKELFVYIAQHIQALEKKLSSFENNWD